MEKYFLVVFTGCLLMFSCKHSDKKSKISITNTNKSITNQNLVYKGNYNDQLLKQYALFLSELDCSRMENSVVAVKKYIELFADQNQDTCDSAFLIFNSKYYYKLTECLDSLHNKDTIIKYDSLVTDSNHHYNKLSPKLSLYAERLKDYGFLVYMSEGDTYIGEDLDFIAKWFYGDVSPQLKEYLSKLNIESKEGFSEDAGLTISPYQLADRAVWWENFAAKYPNSIVTNDAKNSWKNYLATLMEGMDNTPVIDDAILSSYYKTAYSYLQSKYPLTKTNKLINPYFKLQLQNKHKKADELVKNYIKRGLIAY